jgi:hypothetical protein
MRIEDGPEPRGSGGRDADDEIAKIVDAKIFTEREGALPRESQRAGWLRRDLSTYALASSIIIPHYMGMAGNDCREAVNDVVDGSARSSAAATR